jgi:hypothetical protein
MLSGKLVSRMSMLINYVWRLYGTHLGTALALLLAPVTDVARTALVRMNTMENFMMWSWWGNMFNELLLYHIRSLAPTYLYIRSADAFRGGYTCHS